MLLEKPLQSNDVITVKLLTGEELLARFHSENENELVVTKASVIAANPNGMGMIPWMISARPREIKLNKQTVVAFAKTEKEIADKFTEMTSEIKMI